MFFWARMRWLEKMMVEIKFGLFYRTLKKRTKLPMSGPNNMDLRWSITKGSIGEMLSFPMVMGDLTGKEKYSYFYRGEEAGIIDLKGILTHILIWNMMPILLFMDKWEPILLRVIFINMENWYGLTILKLAFCQISVLFWPPLKLQLNSWISKLSLALLAPILLKLTAIYRYKMGTNCYKQIVFCLLGINHLFYFPTGHLNCPTFNS